MQSLGKNLAKTFEYSTANPPLYVTIGIGLPEFLDFIQHMAITLPDAQFSVISSP